MSFQITKKDIFDVWVSKIKIKRFEAVMSFVLNVFGNITFSEEAVKSLKASVRTTCFKLDQLWSNNRNRESFECKNASWLSGYLVIPQQIFYEIPSPSNSASVGRPRKSFNECCEKMKEKKVQGLLDSFSFEEISTAYEISLRKSGKRN